ncbi:hypothetical protein AWB76_03743 [Caballeronia temeraria]|uniref:Uncharacterized protein n=1 Tax=Caballeronia temeraria TaxID=1777137 RepID=A0A158B7B9_9BURK|nr:hypothetical protein [Caballeronia temeraria]SAK65978.1 hypothetical protein AWB76_03743 [Caballeronia temeraria]
MTLETESLALVRADRDIDSGKARIERQRALVVHMRTNGRDTKAALALLGTLEDTLVVMLRFRSLLVSRLAQLKRGV